MSSAKTRRRHSKHIYTQTLYYNIADTTQTQTHTPWMFAQIKSCPEIEMHANAGFDPKSQIAQLNAPAIISFLSTSSSTIWIQTYIHPHPSTLPTSYRTTTPRYSNSTTPISSVSLSCLTECMARPSSFDSYDSRGSHIEDEIGALGWDGRGRVAICIITMTRQR